VVTGWVDNFVAQKESDALTWAWVLDHETRGRARKARKAFVASAFFAGRTEARIPFRKEQMFHWPSWTCAGNAAGY